jgi:hypothetical protein
MNSTSLAGRVASLLPNMTAAATTDAPQNCHTSCGPEACFHSGRHTHVRWICCTFSGCFSQGCSCA